MSEHDATLTNPKRYAITDKLYCNDFQLVLIIAVIMIDSILKSKFKILLTIYPCYIQCIILIFFIDQSLDHKDS